MAFPATYNIQYYKGDTLEFRVYPKDSSGGIFDLTSFSTPIFTIAESRGVSGIPSQIQAFAEKSLDNTHIICVIRAGDGSQLVAGKQYVYDLQINKGPITSPYNKFFTLLTGNISVTEQITGAGTVPAEPTLPAPVTDFTVTGTSSNSISVSWTASPDASTSLNQTVFLNSNLSDVLSLSTLFSTTLSLSATTYTYTNLQPNTTYAIGVLISNIVGSSPLAGTLATTAQATTDPILPSAPGAPIVTVTGTTDTTISLSWTQPSGDVVDSYDIYINNVLAPAPPVDNVSGATSTYTFTGLSPETLYYYSVVAKNQVGQSNPLATTASGAAPTAPTPLPDFVITSAGVTEFLIDGVSNDTITLVRGETYIFQIDALGNPFWIQSSPSPYDEDEVYNDGITNNGTDEGFIIWTVGEESPNNLYYVSEFHPSMSGTIDIIDSETDPYDSYDFYDSYDSYDPPPSVETDPEPEPEPTAPAAPTINSITPGDESLVVNFTAGGDGGSAITNYKYSTDGTSFVAFDPAQVKPTAVTFAVTVQNVNGSNKYFIDGVDRPNLTLYKGVTYTFDQSDASNATHQIYLSETEDGTHGGGTGYTTGVTYTGTAGTNGSLVFEVPENAPATLYYVCVNHSGMGVPATISVEDFSLVISELANGTLYPVTIKAVNAIGDSESSNSVSGTPVAPVTPPEPEPEPEPEPAQTFEVTSSGTSAYIIDGQSNPTLTLVRGESYEFNINASGHPFFIQTVAGAYSSGDVYSEGITGNGTQVGTLTWEVSLSAPDTLYYVCQFHSSMQGTINIIDGDY